MVLLVNHTGRPTFLFPSSPANNATSSIDHLFTLHISTRKTTQTMRFLHLHRPSSPNGFPTIVLENVFIGVLLSHFSAFLFYYHFTTMTTCRNFSCSEIQCSLIGNTTVQFPLHVLFQRYSKPFYPIDCELSSIAEISEATLIMDFECRSAFGLMAPASISIGCTRQPRRNPLDVARSFQGLRPSLSTESVDGTTHIRILFGYHVVESTFHH